MSDKDATKVGGSSAGGDDTVKVDTPAQPLEAHAHLQEHQVDKTVHAVHEFGVKVEDALDELNNQLRRWMQHRIKGRPSLEAQAPAARKVSGEDETASGRPKFKFPRPRFRGPRLRARLRRLRMRINRATKSVRRLGRKLVGGKIADAAGKVAKKVYKGAEAVVKPIDKAGEAVAKVGNKAVETVGKAGAKVAEKVAGTTAAGAARTLGKYALKGIKGIPLLGNVLGGVADAGIEYYETGDVGRSLKVGGASIAGGITGGVLGTGLGPVGTFVGSIGGSELAAEAMRRHLDAQKAGPPTPASEQPKPQPKPETRLLKDEGPENTGSLSDKPLEVPSAPVETQGKRLELPSSVVELPEISVDVPTAPRKNSDGTVKVSKLIFKGRKITFKAGKFRNGSGDDGVCKCDGEHASGSTPASPGSPTTPGGSEGGGGTTPGSGEGGGATTPGSGGGGGGTTPGSGGQHGRRRGGSSASGGSDGGSETQQEKIGREYGGVIDHYNAEAKTLEEKGDHAGAEKAKARAAELSSERDKIVEQSKFKGNNTFDQIAPRLKADLKRDFNLGDEDANAVLGNLGHESGGFKSLQEINPRGGGIGGYGYAQWTNTKDSPRRANFFNWAKEHNLDPRSYEANYGFLKHELQTSHARAIDAVRNAEGRRAKTRAFERVFEGAGVKAYESRDRFSDRAAKLPEYDPTTANGGREPVKSTLTEAERKFIKASPDERQKPEGGQGTGVAGDYVDPGGRHTSPFGPRRHPVTHEPDKMHWGTDRAMKAGSEAKAIAAGTVESIGGRGDVTVKHADGTKSIYRHINPGVRVGDNVTAGGSVGTIRTRAEDDATGSNRMTGPHLHLEVEKDGRKIDPEAYLEGKIQEAREHHHDHDHGHEDAKQVEASAPNKGAPPIEVVYDQEERQKRNTGQIILRDPRTGKEINRYPIVSGNDQGAGRNLGSTPLGEFDVDPNMMRHGATGPQDPLSDRWKVRDKGTRGDTVQDPGIPGETGPSTRTAIRIHQSLGVGTHGCIGVVGDDRVYQNFQKDMITVVQGSGGETVTMRVGTKEAEQVMQSMRPPTEAEAAAAPPPAVQKAEQTSTPAAMTPPSGGMPLPPKRPTDSRGLPLPLDQFGDQSQHKDEISDADKPEKQAMSAEEFAKRFPHGYQVASASDQIVIPSADYRPLVTPDPKQKLPGATMKPSEFRPGDVITTPDENKAFTAAVLDKAGFNDKEKAQLLGQAQAESKFRPRTEDMNYSGKRLLKVFGKKYFKSQEDADAVAAKGPEAIAERVYGGRMGNTEPGDAYKYRGRGGNQLTGKAAYAEMNRKLGWEDTEKDIIKNPDYVNTPEGSAAVQAQYYKDRQKRFKLDTPLGATKATGPANLNEEVQKRGAYAKEIEPQVPILIDQGNRVGEEIEADSVNRKKSAIMNPAPPKSPAPEAKEKVERRMRKADTSEDDMDEETEDKTTHQKHQGVNNKDRNKKSDQKNDDTSFLEHQGVSNEEWA